MKRFLAFLAATVSLGALFVPGVLAADPFRLEIHAVEEQPGEILAVVSAFDINNNPMAQLTDANFRARLDNQDVLIDQVEADSSRLSTGMVLLVDVSGSMAGEPIDQARQALQGFVGSLGDEDEVAIMTFDTRVQLVQDFTSDRALLTQAIAGLQPGDATALYSAVIEGTAKALESDADQRLVVLLSDGVETVDSDNGAAALSAAEANGVSIAAVGLGNDIDRDFLSEITELSNGRLLEAATPAALQTAYAELADAIRSQYTLRIIVPETVNRTIRSQLEIQLTVRNESVTAQRIIEPLFGATAPDYSITLAGIKPGQKVDTVLTLIPAPPSGVELVAADYLIDNEVVYTAESGALEYQLDTTGLRTGSHILKVVTTDANGSKGETIVTFSVPAPPQPSSIGKLLGTLLKVVIGLAVLAVLGLGGFFGFKLLSRRRGHVEAFSGRIRPWSGRELPEDMAPPEEWPERPKVEAPAPRRILGRIVVMNEAAIQKGDLSAIEEYRIGNAPLTFGTGASCDIRVQEDEGRIAAEEARLWIQKGRLVYHKLTTLSAMATEGVTSGWLLLADGEELRLGDYRIVYQSDVMEEEPAPKGPVDEELVHSLQEFEDLALEQKEAEEKAREQAEAEERSRIASARPAPPPGSIAGMWLDPETSDTTASEPPAESAAPVEPPPALPDISLLPTAAEVEAAMPTVEDRRTELPGDDTEALPASSFTDAWTNDANTEAGVEEEPEIDEEMLKALKALEEASLRDPLRPFDQGAGRDDAWDNRSSESA